MAKAQPSIKTVTPFERQGQTRSIEVNPATAANLTVMETVWRARSRR